MESQERYGWGQSQGDDHRSEDLSGNGGNESPAPPGPKERTGKSVNCPDCGKKVKNLGAHKRFCKGGGIIIDDYVEKRLSFLIEGIRQVLKSVKYRMTTEIVDENGEYESLELRIRIPTRR